MFPSRLSGFLVLVLAAPSLVACLPSGGHVGAVATGHFSARHKFPTLIVAWCGDAGPQQIDLVSEDLRRHLVATREFEGARMEIDLSAPGEDWRITDDEGEQVYRLVPESSEKEYFVGIGSEAAAPGEETEHDIGTLVFTTEALAGEEGVYADAGEARNAEFVPQEDFPPEC